jgi:hypothetical protein
MNAASRIPDREFRSTSYKSKNPCGFRGSEEWKSTCLFNSPKKMHHCAIEDITISTNKQIPNSKSFIFLGIWCLKFGALEIQISNRNGLLRFMHPYQIQRRPCPEPVNLIFIIAVVQWKFLD